MTFYSLDGELQSDVPRGRRSTYWQVIRELRPSEQDAIRDALNRYIDGRRVFVSSWIPGKDWSGTPYMPIYVKAAHANFELARWMFGLLVWRVVIDRPEAWFFKKPLEPDENEVMGMTYFQRGED